MCHPTVRQAVLGLLASVVIAATAQPARSQAAAAPAEQKKPWYESVIFKGYIQLDATFPEGNSTYGSVSNFRIRRARPTFIVPIDPLTRVQVQFDLSTPKAGGGTSNVMVTDTFAERDIPRFGSVAFGQRVLPFSREVLEDNAAIRSPLELSYAAEQLALSERDIGVFVRSQANKTEPYHWEIALLNGQGFRSADANSDKTFAGRFVAALKPWAHVGVSALEGEITANGVDYDREAQGYEVKLTPCKAATMTGEFYHVRFVDSPTAPTKPAHYSGGYLMLESWIGSLKSVPFFRYQRTYGDLDYRSYDFGWRWQFAPNQRLTAEYDIVNGHQRNFGGARWQLSF